MPQKGKLFWCLPLLLSSDLLFNNCLLWIKWFLTFHLHKHQSTFSSGCIAFPHYSSSNFWCKMGASNQLKKQLQHHLTKRFLTKQTTKLTIVGIGVSTCPPPLKNSTPSFLPSLPPPLQSANCPSLPLSMQSPPSILVFPEPPPKSRIFQ